MKNAFHAASPSAKIGAQTRRSRSLEDEADPALDRSVLLLLRYRRPLRDEDRDEDKRDHVGGRVDDEDARRPDHADQDARQRGTEQHRHPRRRLEQRVRLATRASRPRPAARGRSPSGPRSTGPPKRAEREGDGEQHAEREADRPVQDGDDEHQRRARRVAEQHRAAARRAGRAGGRREGRARRRRSAPPRRRTLICVAEPVVTSTNHGSASQVICEPVVETTSAPRSATHRA